ncbi:MAG: hypothetical protein EPN84_11570 [Legionella sp.]|nr:MAG: hypothetical protein EPN84_11570 [Legionella sp.]
MTVSSNDAHTFKEGMDALQKIQKKPTYVVSEPQTETPQDEIPFVSRLLRRFDTAGEAAVKMGEHSDFSHLSDQQEIDNSGFHVAEVFIATLNFLLIPITYLAAYLSNRKVPFTLNNNLKWLYAALILGLVITALAVPGIGVIIGLVIASISLTVGVIFLFKSVKEYVAHNRELNANTRILREAYAEMHLIQEEAKQLAEDLKQKKNEQPQQLADIYFKIAVLKERYDAQKKRIEELKTQQLQLQQKISDLQLNKLFKRSIAITLASATIIGCILTFIFPLVGAGILLAAAVVSSTYLLIRIAIPTLEYVTNKLKATDEPQQKSEFIEKKTNSSEPKPHIHESTTDVLVNLNKGHAIETLFVHSTDVSDEEEEEGTRLIKTSPTMQPNIKKKLDVDEKDDEGISDNEKHNLE